MKKPIITVIGLIACVALCAVVWQSSAEVEELSAEPVKAAVSAEIAARSDETPHIFISADVHTHVTKTVEESKPQITEVTAEEKTEIAPTAATTSQAESKPKLTSNEPKPGDRTVIDDEPHVSWIPAIS